DAILGLPRVVKRDNSRMLELCRVAGLAQETLYILVRREAPGALYFERDEALEFEVPGLEHISEGTDPQLRTQLEPVETDRPLQQAVRQVAPGIGMDL